ncbi:unnamed protein product [Rhodiola kirilowii]
MAKRLQHSPETSRINQLSDDVLHLILSFLTTTMAEIARTSILSRRWRYVWHNIDCLDFDASTVLPIERLDNSHAWYIESVNKVIDARIARPGLPLVKDLRIRYKLDASQGCHIDRWINFAIANRVETLHLEFSPYLGLVARNRQYILSEDIWRRAPSGLSNIKCLKSLILSCVNVNKQFIEFVLSSCPLLEDLSMYFSGTYSDLDVSGVPPLRLKRLKIDAVRVTESALTKLCAPYLTYFYYRSSQFHPQKIDVPMLTDLTVGGAHGPLRIMNYLEPFWSYLPQLEKLYLMMDEHQKLKLRKLPELVKLKYLKMCFDWDTDPIFHRIVRFINACPALETFAFGILDGDKISSRSLSIQQQGGIQTRQQRKVKGVRSFKCLKVLEVYSGDGKTIDQEAVECIISKSPNLEKLIIDTRDSCRYPFTMPSKPEIVQAVEAKAKELCRLMSPSKIEITIIG